MTERRFGRARKAVDYAKFGDGEDFDDDFTDSTPPASKKPRLSNKENKEKKKVYGVEKQVKQKSSSNRKSVEERRYERELQEALQLSISQSDPSQGSTLSPHDTDNKEAPPVNKEDEEQNVPSPILPAIDNPPVLTKAMKGENDIEVLETSIEEVPSSQRRARKTKHYIDSNSESGGEDFEIDLRRFLSSPLKTPDRKRKDEDTDFAPDVEDDDDSFDEDDSDDEDDYNPEDDDSDFDSKKTKPTKKTAAKPNVSKQATNKPNVVKTSTAKSSTAKSVKATKNTGTVKSGIAPQPLAASSPSSRTPGSGLTAHKSPNWKPPGLGSEGKSAAGSNTKTKNMIGNLSIGIDSKNKPAFSGGVGKSPLGGVNIKSPSSGLRLGLSRNMKLKPLHPNLKTHN